MMHVEHCGIKEERGKHGSLYERGSSNPQTPKSTVDRDSPWIQLSAALIALFSIVERRGDRFDRTIVILFAVQVRYQCRQNSCLTSCRGLIARQRYRTYLLLLRVGNRKDRTNRRRRSQWRCFSIRGSFRCYSFRLSFTQCFHPFIFQAILDFHQRREGK